MNIWWISMVIIGAVNWLIAVFLFRGSWKLKRREPNDSRYISALSACGILYVSIALYRCVFVSSYPDRLVWFDVILNSPFIIRCMAFLAEMSFIGMIATILLRLNRELSISKSLLAKSPFVAAICIFISQFFAFGGLIIQSQLMFAIEETLWAAAFVSITPLVIIGWRKARKESAEWKSAKIFFAMMTVWCLGYLAFQLFYALPFLYYANLSRDIGRIVPPDALRQAIYDYTVVRDFDAWGGIGFFIWHSGYFSLCVWMALFFMSAPRKRPVSVK